MILQIKCHKFRQTMKKCPDPTFEESNIFFFELDFKKSDQSCKHFVLGYGFYNYKYNGKQLSGYFSYRKMQ